MRRATAGVPGVDAAARTTSRDRKARAEQPIRLYVFDLVALDGELLIDRPMRTGLPHSLSCAQPGSKWLSGHHSEILAEGEEFYRRCDRGRIRGRRREIAGEQIHARRARPRMAQDQKRAHARFGDRRRGWGYGRRKGWLSNYHLAARDEPRADSRGRQNLQGTHRRAVRSYHRAASRFEDRRRARNRDRSPRGRRRGRL